MDLVTKVESIWHKAKIKREKKKENRVIAMMLRRHGGDDGRTVPEKESWVSFLFFYTFLYIFLLLWNQNGPSPTPCHLFHFTLSLGFQNTMVRQLRMVQREMSFEHHEGLQAKGRRGSGWLWVLVEVQRMTTTLPWSPATSTTRNGRVLDIVFWVRNSGGRLLWLGLREGV